MCAFGNRLVAVLLLTVFATTWLHPSEAHLACTIPHSCSKSVGDASLTRYDSANRCVNGPVAVRMGHSPTGPRDPAIPGDCPANCPCRLHSSPALQASGVSTATQGFFDQIARQQDGQPVRQMQIRSWSNEPRVTDPLHRCALLSRFML